MNKKLIPVIAFALALTIILSTAWVARNIFEGISHLEDEFAFLWQASVFSMNKATLKSPEEPRSFLVPFVVGFQGRRFAKYPPGWPAILSLGVRIGAPQIINPVLAGFSIWLIFRLGSKISGDGVGLLSAILASTSPMLFMLSGSMMSHTFSMFLAAAFALSWLDLFPQLSEAREARNRVSAWLLTGLAGSAIGALALTRPLTAVGVVLPFGLHGASRLLRG